MEEPEWRSEPGLRTWLPFCGRVAKIQRRFQDCFKARLIMPQYTYRCKSCQHEFSIEQRMSDPALRECPQCAGELRKVISRVSGVVFKGSGFYVTDNRNGKSSASNSSSSASSTTNESASSSTESSTTTESKSSSTSSASSKESSS